jgi:hypothetical protein
MQLGRQCRMRIASGTAFPGNLYLKRMSCRTSVIRNSTPCGCRSHSAGWTVGAARSPSGNHLGTADPWMTVSTKRPPLRPPVATASPLAVSFQWTVWDHQPAAEVNPGDGAAERASYAHDTGRNGDAADPDWQAGVASGAMLDVRCWMGYRGSKKVRTSALKRAGCSMFEA